MGLPVGQLAKGSVNVNGQVVEYRSLSRKEVLKCGTAYKDDIDGAENFILVCGTGCTEEEAIAFRENTDPTEAGKLIDGIIYLSGLATPENGHGPKGALKESSSSPSSRASSTPSTSFSRRRST